MFEQFLRMNETEEELQKLEEAFPSMAGQAFSAARQRTLASGQSVLQAENGIIFEVFPDGRRLEIKRIPPPVAARNGLKYRMR